MARSRSAPTLGCFFYDDYLPYAMGKKRSWIIDDRLFKKYIDPLFGATPLARIEKKDVERWHGSLLEKGLAPSSCNRVFFVLQTVLARAVRCNYLSINPCTHITLFESGQRQENFLGVADLARLMQYLEDNPTIPNRALQLMLLTGARKFEILNARWDDVDLEKGLLQVPRSSQGKTRDIILSSHACAIICSLQRNDVCPWIFPGRDKKKPYRSLNQNWVRIRDELGLANVCLMDLRHTYASILVERGSTLDQVRHILGHENAGTAMRYFRKPSETMANVVESVAKEIRRPQAAGEAAIHL